MENKEKVLSVKDLVVHFSTDHGYVQAVRGISFDLYKGETLCIVGESGSGKSVTSKSIMGILSANGRIKGGSIMYEGEDLTKISEDEFHRIRGNKIGMIFQDPLSSLNPIVRIGKQITEAMLINGNRLKKVYQDLVAEELIAYKNAQTALKSGISNAKDKIQFLKVDEKKTADNYFVRHNLAEAKLYTLEQEYENNVNHQLNLRHEELLPYTQKYKDDIAAIKCALIRAKENYTKASKTDAANAKKAYLDEVNALKTKKLNITNAYKAKKEEILKKYQAILDTLKSEFKAKKIVCKQDVKKEHRDNKIAVKLLVKDYERQIKEAKKELKVVTKELKIKYKPLIAETKAAFKVKSKSAKKEVRKYKLELKNKYLLDKKALLEKLVKASSDSEHKEIENQLKKLKLDYIAKLRVTKREAKERALKIMAEVGISEPERRFRQYPFEFSGGMRQRIVIAIALTAAPDILICDEPTTALDVTIQAQILELINRIKADRNLSCIFITHDLGVVANMADRVAVMYAGKIVEYGTAEEIFYDPKHPYTWALLASIPDVDSKERLDAIPGTPPNMIYPPVGDAFALRSKYALAVDFKKEPPLFKISDTHYAATWLLDPRAPKVEMPKIVATRIKNALAKRNKGKVKVEDKKPEVKKPAGKKTTSKKEDK